MQDFQEQSRRKKLLPALRNEPNLLVFASLCFWDEARPEV